MSEQLEVRLIHPFTYRFTWVQVGPTRAQRLSRMHSDYRRKTRGRR